MSTLPQPDASPTTVADALAAFLARFERRVQTGARSAATLSMHRGHAGLILRALPPGTRLVELDEQLVEQLVDVDVSGATKRKRLATLYGALGVAQRRGELAALPPRPQVDHVYVPGQAHLRSWDEYLALMAELPERRRPEVAATVLTGQHPSDVARWRAYVDADPFASPAWMVLRNTKNRRTGVRVRMPRELARILQAAFRGLAEGDRVFPAWSHSARWRTLAAASRRAGLERMNPTALRHTCGSWLVRRRGITVAAARWMGHKSTAMMERVYAHALPAQLEELTDELDSMEDAGADARRPPSKVSRKRVGNPLRRRGADDSGPGTVATVPGPKSAEEGPLPARASDRTSAGRKQRKIEGEVVPRDRVELSTHGFSERSASPTSDQLPAACRSLPGKEEGPPCRPTPAPMTSSSSSQTSSSSPPSSTTRRSRSG